MENDTVRRIEAQGPGSIRVHSLSVTESGSHPFSLLWG